MGLYLNFNNLRVKKFTIDQNGIIDKKSEIFIH